MQISICTEEKSPRSTTIPELPEYVLAYPEGSQPLLVSTTNPKETAWLPENSDMDYCVVTNPTTKKINVSSPALGYSTYVPGRVDKLVLFFWMNQWL